MSEKMNQALESGADYEVLGYQGPSEIHERLASLGFHPGDALRLSHRVGFGGAWVVKTETASFALRPQELAGLQLKRLKT